MFDLEEYKLKMMSTIDYMKNQFGKIRTGSANPLLVSEIKVNYYETFIPISQIANIFASDPRLLIINPYDKDAIKDIISAINSENLGFNAVADSDFVKVGIPELNEETRKELVKKVSEYKEQAKIGIRNIRRDANESLKKNKELNKDDQKNGVNEVQKLTDEFITKIDELYKLKEKDLLII